MKITLLTFIRFLSFLITIYIWRIVQIGQFPRHLSIVIIIGSVLLVFPAVWIGRQAINSESGIKRLPSITSIVHFVLMILFGVSIIEAIKTFYFEPGIVIPVPVEVGRALLLITGVILILTVVNLAISGLGAPFAIALSKRLAYRWMYRWTRNPMVLATLATLFSAGIYFQSLYFVLWVVLLVTPAWIYLLKAYEERELEIRFGDSYLDYKSRTSFLWPKKPKRKN